MTCLECALSPQGVSPTVLDAPRTGNAEESEPVQEPPADLPPVDAGVAGASALREYERRRKQREDHARQKLGAIGVGLARVIEEPQTTRVWHRGGNGEVSQEVVLRSIWPAAGSSFCMIAVFLVMAGRTSITSRLAQAE